MAYNYSNPGGTLEKLNNQKPLISRNEELYISTEAKKENALASVGKSCRLEKINMRITTSQYEIYLISGQNSHLPSQNVFRQSVIYSTKKTIILAWGKSRVFSTDPPFLHRRDNNDCRPLHGTWRTLCMNKHLINKAVGRTQKTSFPLSSISKASFCSDVKTNPSSCSSKSRQSTSVILQRKL